MKAMFKPLGLAAAVAGVTAGYAGVTQAQLANNGLGDAAIIPYYTTQGDFISGVHIINTSDLTQVVKLRMRRGRDSMDALDFNIILSPYDEWTGFIDDSSGTIVMATDDTTCTAPLRADGRFAMPIGFHVGAEEGYIEVIGMGSAIDTMPIAIGAKHTALGVPKDCLAVETNFFRVATSAAVAFNPAGPNGILSSVQSAQTCTALVAGVCATTVLQNDYEDTGDVLKVSFFHRDATSGLEFGNGAVHLAGFNDTAMMSNQEVIVENSIPTDQFSYLYPDLDGGSSAVGEPPRGRYDAMVRPALGAASVLNDWSVASARNVSTNWVVTLPGQYLMVDLEEYIESLIDPLDPCLPTVCDQRDLPVTLSISLYDREEQSPTTPQGGLVISPATTTTSTDTLIHEVNVLQWNDGSDAPPVLPSIYAKSYDVGSFGKENGWANLSVSATDTHPQGVWDYQEPTGGFTAVSSIPVPIVGFVAWERSFPQDPSANYGRIVEHSYQQASVAP